MPFVPTKDNCADFFTKPMTGKMFFDLRDKVMNVPRGRDSDDSSVCVSPWFGRRGGVENHALRLVGRVLPPRYVCHV